MSSINDLLLYIDFLSSDDAEERRTAQAELSKFKDEAVPYLAAKLTKHDSSTRQATLDAIIQTMAGIGTDNAHELLFFIANPDPRVDLWSEPVQALARIALDEAGYEPPRWVRQYRAAERRLLVFLLGVEDARVRSSAKEIIVSMIDEIHPDIFATALEDQSMCTNFDREKRLNDRLGQERHPRPHEVFDLLEASDKNGIILHNIACNPRTAIYALPETRQAAVETAQKIGIDTSEWDVFDMDKLNQRLAELDAKLISQTCIVCGKKHEHGKGIRSGKVYFCSTECYQKAMRNPGTWMM